MSNLLLSTPPYEWQRNVWGDFCRRVEADRLPHAFLLMGQEGIGIENLALAMGQYLLCLSPHAQGVCGKCRGCQLLDAGTHPDLLQVKPEEEGKQIKVDQIRSIGSIVDTTAQQGGRKVIVLKPAEAMNVNAANALLKNLEEPAGDTVFLLCSFKPNRVLPTIRSRCAKLQLHCPTEEESLNWMQSMGIQNCEKVLPEALGAPLLAKCLFDEGVVEERLLMIDDLSSVGEYHLEPLAFAKKWSRLSPTSILDPMMGWLESMLLHRVAGKPLPTHLQKLAQAFERSDETLLFRLRDRLSERKAQLQRSPNLNASLFIEELSLDWAAVAKS